MKFVLITLVLTLAFVAEINPAQAATNNVDTVTLGWNPNTEPDLAGYQLYFGQSSNVWTHTKIVPVGTTQAAVPIPTPGTWFFIATAKNTAGIESLPSNMVSYTTPTGPGAATGLRILSAVVTRISTITTATNLITVP